MVRVWSGSPFPSSEPKGHLPRMARGLRIHVSDGWYHVMSRGDGGETLFNGATTFPGSGRGVARALRHRSARLRAHGRPPSHLQELGLENPWEVLVAGNVLGEAADARALLRSARQGDFVALAWARRRSGDKSCWRPSEFCKCADAPMFATSNSVHCPRLPLSPSSPRGTETTVTSRRASRRRRQYLPDSSTLRHRSVSLPESTGRSLLDVLPLGLEDC